MPRSQAARDAGKRYVDKMRAEGNQWFLDNERTRRQLYVRKLRHDVIQGYGGACTCCGETEEAFLQIDHMEGGGNAHRKELKGTQGVYVWLRKNGFPDGYQVLCANCNMAKEREGGCPHQRGE